MKDSQKIIDQYNELLKLTGDVVDSKSLSRLKGTIQGLEFYKISFLADIAIQLAKIKEHFEMIDESVFGGRSELKEKKV